MKNFVLTVKLLILIGINIFFIIYNYNYIDMNNIKVSFFLKNLIFFIFINYFSTKIFSI